VSITITKKDAAIAGEIGWTLEVILSGMAVWVSTERPALTVTPERKRENTAKKLPQWENVGGKSKRPSNNISTSYRMGVRGKEPS
jgi:hypothetical protein